MIPSHYIRTYKSIIRLGFPIMLGQLGIIIVGFVDTAMVGRYSTDALAAASFVNTVFALIIMLSIGFSFGLTPIVSSLFARGENFNIGETVKNAFILNMTLSIVLTLLMTALYFNLEIMGQPEELLPLIRTYYITMLVSIIFVAAFNVLRQVTDGVTHTSLAMWLIVSANIINIIFNYLLIFGKFGFPELGLLGAGLSTLGSRVFMCISIILFLFISKRYASIREGFFKGKLSILKAKDVFKKSWPVAVQMGLETGYFALCGVMIGWLGAIPLASYQIIFTLGTCGFMVYYSFASSMAIVGSNHYGLNNIEHVRLAAKCGCHIIIAISIIVSILFLIFGESVVMAFTTDPVVIASAMSLILPLVLYQIGDAAQIVYANALRSISHVMPMMVIAAVSFMCVGLPTTYIFGFVLDWQETGIFYSYSVSLLLAAYLYRAKFLSQIHKLEKK